MVKHLSFKQASLGSIPSKLTKGSQLNGQKHFPLKEDIVGSSPTELTQSEDDCLYGKIRLTLSTCSSIG